ncbi:hypothetical protein B879_03836 [Cecembia lonarensis LW9]|uniref:Uncharacterized protein n=1 Tax=Cecembia lonarensis (strain CCUG 58316 / KCTC 22772 / LW9) TaxID=1225176 RepID=K1LAZ1_CECL9|nr:hypothetical protein B879_03836 [Cecembia lonarensis LW9]
MRPRWGRIFLSGVFFYKYVTPMGSSEIPILGFIEANRSSNQPSKDFEPLEGFS